MPHAGYENSLCGIDKCAHVLVGRRVFCALLKFYILRYINSLLIHIIQLPNIIFMATAKLRKENQALRSEITALEERLDKITNEVSKKKRQYGRFSYRTRSQPCN